MKKNPLKAERSIIKARTRDGVFQVLYSIYKNTIQPGIEYNTFVSMYCSDELMYIDFTLFTDEGKHAGFSAAFCYRTQLGGRQIYILRAATGLTKDYQGQGLHDVSDLYLKFVRFALRHPFAPKYAVAFVINPIVFSDLCRFIPKVYPKPGIAVPESIEHFMDEIARRSGHERDSLHPYSVAVPIQVEFTAGLLKRMYSSKDENIKWFLLNAPRFLEQYGLLTVIHITWKNVWGTVLHLSSFTVQKQRKRIQRNMDRKRRARKQGLSKKPQDNVENLSLQ